MKKTDGPKKNIAKDETPPPVQQETYPGIKLRLHALVNQVISSFNGSGPDKELIFEALENAEKLEILTEEDKYEYLLAFYTLTALYLEKFPAGEEIKEMTETYNNCNALLHYLFATDSLYNRSNIILYEYIASLSKQEEAGNAFTIAINKLSALPFTDSSDDKILRGKALARLLSAMLAYDWFLVPHPDGSIEDPADKEFAALLSYLETNNFSRDEIINTFNRVEEMGKKYTGDIAQLSNSLLRIYGLGILLSPQCAPALEILENRVVELTTQYLGQSIRNDQNEKDIVPVQKTAEDIISAFDALVKKDGTSVYAFDQAVADLKKLPQETAEQNIMLLESLMKICDIGIEYSHDETTSGPIKVAKESLQKSMAMVDNYRGPYTAKEVKEILDQNLLELKQNLEKGELPDTAITRAFTNAMTILPSIPTDEKEAEEVLKIFMHSMVTDLFSVIGNYITEDKKEVWKETMKTMGFVTDAVDHLDDNEIDAAISLKRFEAQNQRYINSALHLPVSNQAMSTFYITQFLDLYPGLAIRFIDMDVDDNTSDKLEYDRLKADLQDTFKLLSSAYTIEQFMQHQKVSLRRMSIELSQFERRRFLMIAGPVFPARDVVVDPNRVFFSGTGELVKPILNACNTLGMVLSTKRSVSNQLDSRWTQIRESALAIFDYSIYDPVIADPNDLIQSESYHETEVLAAAGPVAIVAYENGWAYALGKPLVIITKKGNPIPFDIDIEPVVLEGDGKDEERIIAGIQVSLFGVNRTVNGSCLTETVNYAKNVFDSIEDEKVKSLLNSMTDTKDASKIRFTMEAILDRASDKNLMLVTPAFPGRYPGPGTKKVFHVTGFREWSKPLETELKKLCTKRGLDFTIGYDKINPEILPAIWKDISESSFIIADITNLNPNAVLELAMAQAIGRPTLILTQNKDVQNYFPPVQKIRTHYYDPYKSKKELIDLLENFFSGKE